MCSRSMMALSRDTYERRVVLVAVMTSTYVWAA